MAVVHKAVFLGYSTEQMFALVDRVEDYPLFLPWCGGVEVLERQDHRLVAKIAIQYHGVHHTFTTENTNAPPTSMKMQLVEGPFRHLDGKLDLQAAARPTPARSNSTCTTSFRTACWSRSSARCST